MRLLQRLEELLWQALIRMTWESWFAVSFLGVATYTTRVGCTHLFPMPIGTGMGVGIIANKFTGVRAATCENVLAARCSRAVNDANVLCLGQLVTKPEDAKVMAEEFLFKQQFISHPAGEDDKPLSWWNGQVEEFLKTSKEGIEKVETEAKKL